MRNGWKLAVLMAGTLGCASAGTQATTPPPDVRLAAVEDGNEAINALQGRLFQRLSEELERGGAKAAIPVCRDEAQAMTAQVGLQQGVEVGRTSHRLRNPKNAPRAWVAPYVAQWAGKKLDEVQPVVVDLGDRVGLLRPIPTAALCTSCHGATAQIEPEVREVIRQAYPQDQGVGFAEGDLRGVFWAEVPKERTPLRGN
jgi:hypothetical protein